MKIINITVGILLLISTISKDIISLQIGKLTSTTETFLLIIGTLGVVLV